MFVSYKNKNGPVQIHTANRTVCHREANDDLFSIDSQPYAYYDGEIKLNDNYAESESSLPVKDAVFCENPRIFVVNVLPGEAYDYDLSQYNAVIFRPYHCGTLNTSSENLRNFCDRAKEHSVPLFVVNAPGGVTYESSKEYEALGITVLPMCSFPAIYMKLWLGVSKKMPLKPFVLNSVSEEFL